MRIVSSLLGSLVLLVALCFAVTNRQAASISLWPFDVQVEAPLYLLTLGSLFTGLLLGAIIAWVGLLPHRLAARRLHKELVQMNKKIAELQQSLTPATAPALPSRALTWRFWNKD